MVIDRLPERELGAPGESAPPRSENIRREEDGIAADSPGGPSSRSGSRSMTIQAATVSSVWGWTRMKLPVKRFLR